MRRLPAHLLGLALAFSPLRGETIAQSGGQTRLPSRVPVHGTVTDPTGAAISSVTLQVLNPDGSPRATVTSSPSGVFDLPGLPPGAYLLFIPASKGFAPQTLPLTLTSPIANLSIVLLPAAVSENIDIGTNESLSTDSSANKDTITLGTEDIRKVPVFDQDLIGAITPFLDSASTSTGGVTIVVDGVEMKASTVSPSAVSEIRINNDPYSAEFSRPGRGRIEIITKPGSPEYHGNLNFITRDAVFNSKNYFAPVRPPEQRRIFEGHLTGPVGRGGHTTFLLSGDLRQDDAFVTVIASTLPAPLNVSAPRTDAQANLRLTHDFSANHRLSLAYNFENSTRHNGNVGGLILPEAATDVSSREDDLIFNDRLILSPTLINQLQITFEKDEDTTRSLTNAPSIQVDGAFTAGGAQADIARTENTVHINEVVTWSHRNHYLRFGANIPQFSRRAINDRTNRLGTFAFNSLADYTSPTPTPYVFTVQQGPGRGLYWINEIGGFVSDQIKVTRNLQITLGLRYQWQTYISDNTNFAPRLSAAYSLNPKTILRGGAGLFWDRTGGDFPGTLKVHNGVVLRSYQVLNPGYPNPLPAGESFSSLPTNLVRMAPRVRTPYATQYSFGIERQLTPNLTLIGSYRGIFSIGNFRSRDANAPFGPAYTTRPDPSLGFVQQIEAQGRLISNAFDLSLRGRVGHWVSGQAQYTLSRAWDNTGGINFYPQDQYNPSRPEWARAEFDRLHRFNLIGTLNPDPWLSLGVSATLYSGIPYTETAGLDLLNTGLSNARPPGVGRNTLEAGGTADLDLLWEHDIKLTHATRDHAKLLNLGVSAFNVLNHPNFLSYIGNVRSSRFQQPTAALPGRQLQFSIGYQF